MKKTDESWLMERFKEKCKAHNLKVTPQRTMIYRELLKSSNHPNSDSMFKKIRGIYPNISFDTVNRTLLTFSRIGIVNIVEGYGDPKRFDPNVKSHHHFRCLKCSEITDVFHEYFDKIEIPKEISENFSILNKKIILEGICKSCSETQ